MNSTAPADASILLIEDDPHIAGVLKFLLERAGYSVEIARDGRVAREFIEHRPAPDLVLLDLMLPYVGGQDLLTTMRAHPNWKGTPIVVLSAKSDGAGIAHALDAGADDYLVKPFQPEELQARLRRLLRKAPPDP